MSYAIGLSAGYEALEHQRSLSPLLETALRVAHTPTGAGMTGGLLEVMAAALDAMQAAKRTPDMASQRAALIAQALPRSRRLQLLALCQHVDQDTANVLGDLAGAISLVRTEISVGATETPGAASPTTIDVRIVGLPDRITTTSVARRNSDDKIVSTEHHERDALVPENNVHG